MSSIGESVPGTPQRRRPLVKEFSDPKGPETKRFRRRPSHEAVVEGKASVKAKQSQQQRQNDGSLEAGGLERQELIEHLFQHGVPQASHQRLLPLLERFGPARTAQALGLWTFLGDGETRLPATASLQVWGPAGSGKTEVLLSYLQGLGIDHVKLSCACFTSSGELLARLAEELRQCALAKAEKMEISNADALKRLRQKMPPGRQIRALDRLEVALKLPLEHLSGGVVVVLDHCQQLSSLGQAADELLLQLPEVLQCANRLVLVFVSRLPLSCLGVPVAREPPAVAFQPYSATDVEKMISSSLSRFASSRLSSLENGPSSSDLRALTTICVSSLMTFAVPYVGHNMHDLLRIGEEILRTKDPASLAKASSSHLGQRVEEIVQQRLGLCDLTGLLERGQVVESSAASCAATVRRMVKTEKRLLVAAYLGSRLHKDDDVQHFMPAGRGRCRRSGMVRHQPDELQEPRPVSLTRLLAIYHRLAQEPHVLSSILLEQLVNLHEAGLLRIVGGPVAVDRDAKVVCRAEPPVVSACAANLNICLPEYGLQR